MEERKIGSTRENTNKYNFWSVFSSNQLDKWTRKEGRKKTKWHDLEFGLCEAEARGTRDGVIRVGR